MVDKVFDRILTKGIRKGHAPGRDQDAREWYRQKSKDLRKPKKSSAISEAGKSRKNRDIQLGSMQFFEYSAKWKDELPYWDKVPLVFAFDEDKDSFLGLNLHYLPPKLRAKLMDALYDLSTDDKYSESTKLRLSYQVLKSASKYKLFKPCIKRYLKENVRSSFVEVEPSEWDIALFLPLASWQGASSGRVYADSRKKV